MTIAALLLLAAAGGDRSGTPALSNLTAGSVANRPASADAVYTLRTDGVRVASGNANENWLSPATNVADYEVMATYISGEAPTGGTLSSWLPFSSDRTWSLVRTVDGISTGVIRIEIRAIANPGVILATADIILQAVILGALP